MSTNNTTIQNILNAVLQANGIQSASGFRITFPGGRTVTISSNSNTEVLSTPVEIRVIEGETQYHTEEGPISVTPVKAAQAGC